ncbi:uncharacterized protein JCM10292_007625 [Rhodotorula paludigena]|uniref:uncharacterized protein n=1 Tax=Rhodotorula paludigena TaxID=86838 RepID=UPI00317793C7
MQSAHLAPAGLPEPSPPPSPSPHIAISLLTTFRKLDERVDSVSQQICSILEQLSQAAKERLACLDRLEAMRRDRDRVLRSELASQQRSREILAQARQEHLLQEAWAGEIRELYIRAELEGVDISTTTASVWTGEEEKEAAAVERGEEEVVREERANHLGRQFLYLTHSTRKSETRLRSLLSHLEAAQSAPSYRDELSRLHRETVRYSTNMVAAAARRQELAAELDEAEQTRASVEEKRDETVLDLVLDWKDRRWFRHKPDNALGDLPGEGDSMGQHKDLEREGSSWCLCSAHNPMLSWLASWFFDSGGTAVPPAAPGAPKQLSEEQLNALHAQWIRMQSSHQAEAQRLLGRLVEENNTLKAALETTERDLKDVRAGRKADEEALKKAHSEMHRLTGGDVSGAAPTRRVPLTYSSPRSVAVAILDLEADLFCPAIYNQPDPARAAADALHRKLRESLRTLPNAQQHRKWHFVVWIFWQRNGDFVRRAVSNGLFASPRQFDEFLISFNRVHPLFTLFVHNGSHEETRQRERAFAALAAQNPLCFRLLLGRWAYDSALAEMLAPTKGLDEVAFPTKVVFVEPVVGFYLSSHLRKREPRIIEAEGLLRKHPLDGSGKLQSTLHIDFSRPLWQQNPPLCLDHYLSTSRCIDERCEFSHAYRLEPDVLQALRFELSRTPCPLLLSGYDCPDEKACYFAHACPYGDRCKWTGCRFTAAMHPAAALNARRPDPQHPPPELRASMPSNRQLPAHPSNLSPSAGSAGNVAREAAAAPSSTRMALERMLAAATKSSVLPSPRGGTEAPGVHAAKPTPPSVSRKHHLAPQSPFGHPLSLADAASALGRQYAASAAGTGDVDAVDMTDDELAALLAKVRREEEEYEKGLSEDPFAAGAPSPVAAAPNQPSKSNGVS